MSGNSATRGGNYRKTERRLRVLIIFQRTVQMFTTHLLQIYEKESAQFYTIRGNLLLFFMCPIIIFQLSFGELFFLHLLCHLDDSSTPANQCYERKVC